MRRDLPIYHYLGPGESIVVEAPEQQGVLRITAVGRLNVAQARRLAAALERWANLQVSPQVVACAACACGVAITDGRHHTAHVAGIICTDPENVNQDLDGPNGPSMGAFMASESKNKPTYPYLPTPVEHGGDVRAIAAYPQPARPGHRGLDSNCVKCWGTGVIDTGNNDLPCSCPQGDLAIFNVAGKGQQTGAEIRAEHQARHVRAQEDS